MEGSCNDWRTQHEPYLRRKVIFAIVKKLKTSFHQHSENDIKNMAFRFEDKIYGMATDKDDYWRRLKREVLALNQGQSLSTSLPYTQTPTSQQSLLNQPIQQQLPHDTSLTTIDQSSPQSSALSSLPSSGQPNSKQKQPEHENLIISQLVNPGQDTQENHLTSPQNKGEEQEQTPRVSTSKQNNMSSFNVNGSPSFLGTQDQEVEQYHQPSGGGDDDWREETYQKIKALKEKYVHALSILLQTFSDKLREIDSLSQQKNTHELVECVKRSKSTLELLLEFLNVCKSSVSEFHRDKFSRYEGEVLRFNKLYQTKTQRSMQQQKQQQPQTESQEHPPLVTLQPETLSERPIDRLIKAIQSSSPESLAQSVSEMSSIISFTDRFDGSVQSIGGFRARLGEDLSERTRLRLQQGDTNPNKRFKRSVTARPLDSKVNKIEPSYALLQEIIEINGRLVETVVSICNEDVCPSEVTSGIVVMCSYVPVALSSTFKALYSSGHISQIQPLRLQVPENYPYSPIAIEKDLLETASVQKHEDLSARARSRFGWSIKEYSGAMSLKEIAKVWDESARATMLEYAERHGGGTFSSKYGRWESVLF